MSGLDLKIGVTRPRCPYCHGDVLVDEPKAACDACMAWHHAECFEETGGCGACGEQGAALRRVSDPASPPSEEHDPEEPLQRLASVDPEPEPDIARRIRERFEDPEQARAPARPPLAIAIGVGISVMVAAAVAIGGAGLFLLLPATLIGTVAALQLHRDPVRRRRARAIRLALRRRRRQRRRARTSKSSE